MQKMEYGEIVYALLIVIIAVLSFVIIKCLSNKANKKMTDGSFVMSLPKGILVLGVANILITLMILLGVIFFDEDNSLGDILFVFCFSGTMLCVSIYLIAKTLLYKIVIEGNEITVYSIIRRTYSINFEEITCAKIRQFGRGGEGITIATASKKFSVDNTFIEYERFVKLIHRKVNRKKIQKQKTGNESLS